MRNNQESVWMLQTKRADFNAIAARFHISPVTARIIRNRDVEGEKAIDRYLNGTLDQLYDPHLMKDMDKAAALILEKIRAGVRIRIVGDYDIDGVCSTYLLYRGLTRCGADVDYQIPERIRDGYGINESIIRKAKEDRIDTIVTCDNGIAALEQVRLAKELGMTVIVTDHHEVVRDEDGSQVLPEADAVVNPHRDDCTYPFAGICGGVVAYKLVQVLYEKNGIPEQEWKDMLEFAAIATVGDVMKLQDENRIIVRWGLKQIPHTASAGLRALVEACGLDIYDLTAYHIGFVIGPCLNASGRLKTAKLAQVLDKRTSQKTESPLTLDFGEIQANGSLKTNTFPVPIPKGDYTICRLAAGLTLSTSEQSWLGKSPSGVPLHSHSVTIPAVKAGDRVLVAWIQSEAVVIDVIEKS